MLRLPISARRRLDREGTRLIQLIQLIQEVRDA
jgi:hypothetical protein